MERLLGYRDAMQSLAEQGTDELEIEGDFSEESGLRAGEAILRMQPRPTAVFAANDAGDNLIRWRPHPLSQEVGPSAQSA